MEQTEHNDTLPERPSSIDWQTESSESNTKQASPDGRWHLDTKVERDGKRQMYLVNYDSLCSPSGSGETTAECWRKFIESCGEYARKLDAICADRKAAAAAVEAKE